MPQRPAVYRPVAARVSAPPRSKTAERGYGGRWQRVRAAYLNEHPLCVACQVAGRIVGATVVDHKTPHKGDPTLMWDRDNYQALCARCHSRKTVAADGGLGRPTVPGRTH